MRKRMYVLFLSVVLLFSNIQPVIGAEQKGKLETDVYSVDEVSFVQGLRPEIVASASTKLDELINCIKKSDKEDEDGNKFINYSGVDTSSDSAVVSYESQVVFVENLNRIILKNEISITQAFSRDTFNSEVELDVTSGVADKMHIYRTNRSGTILVSGNTTFKMSEIDEDSVYVFAPEDTSDEISDSDNDLFSSAAKRSFEFWDTCMIQGADGISLKDIGFSSWGKGKLLHSGECGNNAKWELRKNGNGDQILYISGSGKMKNYDYYPDTAKAPWANYEINHLIVEDGVTSIGNRAMDSQTKLKSVSMGSTVKTIGEWCFYECSSLSSVTLSEELTTIGDAAFWDCVGIREITIPGKVKNISSSAFDGCANLETIRMSEGIEEIAYQTFADLSSLENVYLPKSLKKIGSRAFYNCTSLEKIYYAGTEEDWDGIDIDIFNDSLDDVEIFFSDPEPDPVDPNPEGEKELTSGTCGDDLKWVLTKTLSGEQKLYIKGTGKMTNYSYSSGSKAPWSEYQIDQLIVEDGVSSIGEYALYKQSKLKTVSMDSSVESIGEKCFNDCSALKEVKLSDKLTTIGDRAFDGCSSLTDLELPGTVKNIGSYILNDCNNLKTLKLSDGITEIPDFAFKNLTALENLYLPDSLEKIGLNAFDGCTALSKVYYGGTEDDWDDIEIRNGNGVLDDAEMVYSYNDNPDNPSNPDNPNNPDNPDNGNNNQKGENGKEPEISVSDNKPMDYSEETIGSFKIGFNHSIPFWGKSKLTLSNFDKITVSFNGQKCDVTKIKVNKKKHLIQITGLSGADKGTVKDVKKLTKGPGGLPFKVNPYYVTDKDTVEIKRKKDGSIKTVKVGIGGKPYKAKKGEWKQVSANSIEFTGNLAGSLNIGK